MTVPLISLRTLIGINLCGLQNNSYLCSAKRIINANMNMKKILVMLALLLGTGGTASAKYEKINKY